MRLNDIHIAGESTLLTPAELKQQFPISEEQRQFIGRSRNTIASILNRSDKRQLAIVGPCSIHDIKAAKEYALKLKALAENVSDSVYVVMRVYFEKPRTTTGWKGLINDPDMNDSFDMVKGLQLARELLLWLAEHEIAAGTEMLDPISPQYIGDLISWGAIGARTSESQTHREMASGLSMPIGFKNGTDGDVIKTINALKAAASPHRFLGINQQGKVTLLSTTGNPQTHVILRGGKTPNYGAEHVADYRAQLLNCGMPANIMIDCSHSNSNKDYRQQSNVLSDVIGQIEQGDDSIIGFMLESFLAAGNQKITPEKEQLQYGISVTDACIDWQTTEYLLKKTAEKLRQKQRNTVIA